MRLRLDAPTAAADLGLVNNDLFTVEASESTGGNTGNAENYPGTPHRSDAKPLAKIAENAEIAGPGVGRSASLCPDVCVRA